MASRPRQISRIRQAPSHQNHAAVFGIALLLPAIVGTFLFFGTAQLIPRTEFGVRQAVPSRVGATAIRRSTPVDVPTSTARTPVASLASVPMRSTPLATTVATPVATTVATQVATAVATVVETTTALSLSGTSPLPTPARFLIAHVGNTQGDGVFLRHTPRLSDRWIAWVDGTPLVMLGDEQDGDGQHWLQVRDPKNDIGWVPAQFVTN